MSRFTPCGMPCGMFCMAEDETTEHLKDSLHEVWHKLEGHSHLIEDIERRLNNLSSEIAKGQRFRELQAQDEGKSFEEKYPLQTLPSKKIWIPGQNESINEEWTGNLREPVDGAVWNEEHGFYLYTWEQALEVIPKGFRLPSAREYMTLLLNLGYLANKDSDVAEQLQEKYGFVSAKNYGQAYWLGNYWTATPVLSGEDSNFVHTFRLSSNGIVINDANQEVQAAVRLIKV